MSDPLVNLSIMLADCSRMIEQLPTISEHNRLRDLVLCLIENDPNEVICDGGVTVLDQWRKDARRALGLGVQRT